MLEQWHREESSGARNEQLEQEQHQQEQTESEHEIPREIAEPSIELTIAEPLQEIEGDDEVSESVLPTSYAQLQELEGTNDRYPISGEFGQQEATNPLDLLMTEDF